MHWCGETWDEIFGAHERNTEKICQDLSEETVWQGLDEYGIYALG